jgi:hypothetical protein
VLKHIAQEQGKSRGEELFPKLVEHKGEIPLIKDILPTIFHDELNPPGTVSKLVESALRGYRDTLPPSYQSLLDRFTVDDAAVKVVGIGSVGTSCWVLLLMTRENDPLFLQVKEARPSVLEPYAGASVLPNHGQRVVNGYRLMQPASDVFLGWTRGRTRDFFVRQLRDVKIAPRVESFGKYELGLYAQWCGRPSRCPTHDRERRRFLADTWETMTRSIAPSRRLPWTTPTRTNGTTQLWIVQSARERFLRSSKKIGKTIRRLEGLARSTSLSSE